MESQEVKEYIRLIAEEFKYRGVGNRGNSEAVIREFRNKNAQTKNFKFLRQKIIND